MVVIFISLRLESGLKFQLEKRTGKKNSIKIEVLEESFDPN